MSDEQRTLADVVERCFRGTSVEKIAAETGLDRDRVADVIGRLDAVLVLLAHDVPDRWIPLAARISADEARIHAAAVRKRAQTPERIRELVVARGLERDAANPRSTAPAAQTPGDDAAQALDVLDFWASKWL